MFIARNTYTLVLNTTEVLEVEVGDTNTYRPMSVAECQAMHLDLFDTTADEWHAENPVSVAGATARLGAGESVVFTDFDGFDTVMTFDEVAAEFGLMGVN